MREQPLLLQNCKNCGHSFEGKYCNKCGEKVYSDHDKSIFHFLEEGLHFITHFEGTFFRTLSAIFSKPGKLTFDYNHGIRKRYFKPLSFFLLLVVLYLIFPLFPGLNMKLEYHINQFPYAAMAKDFVQNYLKEHPDANFEKLSAYFATKSEKTSKLLLFIIIPLTALPIWLFFKKQRPYFFDSLVLSTEFNSFFLITQFFIMPLLITILYRLSVALNIKFYSTELVMGIIEYFALTLFMRIALQRLFGASKIKSLLVSLPVMVWHIITVYFLYKFLLFVLVSVQLH